MKQFILYVNNPAKLLVYCNMMKSATRINEQFVTMNQINGKFA